MSTGITTCCPCVATPVAAVPVATTPATSAPVASAPTTPGPTVGGGTTITSAPPEPLALPLAPAPTTGGGATSYQSTPAPSISNAGYVPAPTMAPAPIGAAAAQLPTWPQWQQEFAKLGLNGADLAKLGSQPLDDEQLAVAYQQVFSSLQQGAITNGPVTTAPTTAPTTPQTTSRTTPQPTASNLPRTGGWSPEWKQAFADLKHPGLDAAAVTDLEKQAKSVGATDEQLEQAYQQLAAEAADPAALAAAEAAKPAWSPAWEKKFAKLGMPEEVIKTYAGAGINEAGLKAAYDHASDRIKDFRKDGSWGIAERAGLDKATIWSGYVLADQKRTADSMEHEFGGMNRLMGNIFSWAGQTGLSLVPGVRALEYAAGKEKLTGAPIKRDDGFQIAAAVGSAALVGV
ncbi:MAG: hypothetical protein JWO69_581, partial [Thermoleophilia bacterium]|nr:hypothetical protein [Thermoleophilia bacterium]